MKTIRQLIVFILGTAAGIGLYSLIVFVQHRAKNPGQIAENVSAQAVIPTSTSSQKAPFHRGRRHTRAHSSRHLRAVRFETAEVRMPVRHRRHRVSRHVFASSQTMALAGRWNAPLARNTVPSPIVAQVVPAPQVQPPPTFFKSIGYVEKADGQLEAVIMEDDQVQVVRIGDRIADKYKVTSITPEVVRAIEDPVIMAKLEPTDMLPHGAPEALVSETRAADQTPRPIPVAVEAEVSPTGNSSRTNTVTTAEAGVSSPDSYVEASSKSMGYVEKYDGKVDSVMAEGDSVRLVPTRQAKFVTKFTALVDQPSAIQNMQTAPTRDKKSQVALPSSDAHKPAAQPGVPAQGTTFRQVVYEDSSPADDESVPVQPAINRAGDQNP